MYYPARLDYSLLSVQRRFIVAGRSRRSRQVTEYELAAISPALAAARYGHVYDKCAVRCVYQRLTSVMGGLNDHEKKISMIGQ